MAKNEKPDGASEPKKGGKKLIIILSVVVFLVLGVVGAGAYWFFFMGTEEFDEEVAVQQAEPEKKKAAPPVYTPPVYVDLDTFTVNLLPEDRGEQFLQIKLSIEVRDAAAGDRFKLYTPKIRNDATLLLSNKRASDLVTSEGKEKLANDLRTQMNEILHPGWTPTPGGLPADATVKAVLFNSFIIQ